MKDPVHLLLVEDDDIDAMAVKRALREYRIANPLTLARDGLEALEFLRGNGKRKAIPRPNLVLLDINMPRM
ncbi:MAG: two-component system response regulator, partial [Alphaproteobacteria bacterium]|nr:two-component system response regulator [Alphaproteobacteria bacterium]